MIERRDFAFGFGASVILSKCAVARVSQIDPIERLQAIERASGGRLGAFILDTGSGQSFGWRADERFCHCSTFKLSLAAMALRESDANRLDLAETLTFSKADIAGYSPVVERNLAKGRLPIITLVEAVQVTSDLAVLVPPGDRSPLVVIGYFENPSFSEDVRPGDEAALKALGEVAVAWRP